MVESSALEPGLVVAGRYRIERKIGEGGMGAVYLVRHVHTDESLAMKVLHPQVLRDAEAVARFRREARAPARIASEHVTRVTDADTAPDLDNAPFYVMEYLRGEDLERILLSKGPIAPPLVVEYIVQTARALDKAHPLGVVHRDLKPENLFLTEREDGSPCIKLLDFGIARLGDSDAPGQLKTAEGFIFGTPTFMSPEQTIGSVDLIGPGSDIWALGLVTFKLLTGKDFWGAANLQQLYAMILSMPIPAPSEKGAAFGPQFDAWFARCVARKVEDRFKTAGEAASALAEALGVRIERRMSSVSLAAIPPYESRPDGVSSSWAIPPGTVSAPAEASAPVSPAGVPALTAMPEAPAAPKRSHTKLIAAGAGAVLALLVVAGVFVAVDRSTRPEPARVVGSAAPPSSSVAANVTPPPSSAGAKAPSSASAGVPTPVVEAPKPRGGGAMAAAGGAGGGAAAGTRATTAAKEAPPATEPAAGLSREQKRRLDALQRLCDQGTFTAAECKAKRAGILRGEN